MKEILSTFKNNFWQITLYLFVNLIFIIKYVSRINVSTAFVAILYIFTVIGILYLFFKFSLKFSQSVSKYATYILLAITLIIIILALIYIDPYSVRVDRWSAVSFFLESLFKGDYPYGVHTHVSETNFPSPFPFWFYINLPFYLLGDVGIGLIFFLIITFSAVQLFFKSYKKTLFFFVLLILSPAYWWEVVVRSDALSNSFLVLVFILWYARKNFSIHNNFILTVLCCGIIATTRLSAVLPVTLFLFGSYLKVGWIKKLLFPISILTFTLITFLPFILWNVDDKLIFFSRNPFMSQTSVGNPVILILMILIGIVFSLKWKNTSEYFGYAASFIFIFMLGSQLSLMLTQGITGTPFTDNTYDLSYFTLYLPYTLLSLTSKMMEE